MKPRTLVVVITHPEAEPILRMNLPWIKRSNCDLRIVDHEGTPNRDHLPIGRAPHLEPHRWIGRFIQIVHAFRAPPMASRYTDFFFCEYDTVIVRTLPSHPGGLVTHLAGGKSEGFLGRAFYHSPWWVDQATAEEFLLRARMMLSTGFQEGGFIDRFIGLMDDLYPQALKISPAEWFSRNTIEPEHYAEVNAGFKSRKYYGAHGVKTEECLKAITEGLT